MRDSRRRTPDNRRPRRNVCRKTTGRSSNAPKRSSTMRLTTRSAMRSGTPTRTCPSACPSRRPGHRIGPAAPGLPAARDRPDALIPAAREAGKCQDGLSRKRRYAGPGNPMSAGPACVPADLSTNPKHIAAIPNGIARTPIEPIGPPLLPTSPLANVQRQRTSPDAGARKPAIAARMVRAGPVGGFRRRSRRGPIAGVGEGLSLRQPSRFEGGEREQRHFRSA